MTTYEALRLTYWVCTSIIVLGSVVPEIAAIMRER